MLRTGKCFLMLTLVYTYEMRCTEFLRIKFPEFWMSQNKILIGWLFNSEIWKKTWMPGIQNRIGILLPMGVPEIGTKNQNSQPRANAALPFALSFWFCFFTMTRSIASRSGNNSHVDSGTVRWARLYWFCHVIETDVSTLGARSALPKEIFPLFVIDTALGVSFNVGRCLT